MMLLEPLCQPQDDELLFHYCSVETFKAICENRTIRFSDAASMNDTAEREWGIKKLLEALPALQKLRDSVTFLSRLDDDFYQNVGAAYHHAMKQLHPFIAAFSRQPDILSQWRAYADDGRGFSIGLKGHALKALKASLYNVVYDEKDQIRLARDALGALFVAYDQNESPKDFIGMAGSLVGSLLSFKSPAYAEEQEVRSVHLVDIKDKGFGKQFSDEDGQTIKYRVAQGQLIAYFDMFLSDTVEQPVGKIWLGPKNNSNEEAVGRFLANCSLTGIEIERSQIAYR